MDSLPQEIIDEIIDNLPASTLSSSSLVASRWRIRSQQRAFSTILFRTESMVNNWYTHIQRDPGGLLSHVKSAGFTRIDEWKDPALFGRVFKNFNSLLALGISDTRISDEMLEHISHGEPSRITTLCLRCLRCSLSTLISVILAFPNLRNLTVVDVAITARGTSSAHSVLSRRKPLDSLLVHGCGNGTVTEVLANHQFSSRRLILDVQPRSIQKLLVISSEAIYELVLIDLQDQSTSHLIDLPPFPSLSSLKIFVAGCNPSPHLIGTLSPISSAPVLAFITLECSWKFPLKPDPSNSWEYLDGWLSQMAKRTTAEGGLVLTLTRWEEDSVPDAFLPKFREVGKIVTDPFDQTTRL